MVRENDNGNGVEGGEGREKGRKEKVECKRGPRLVRALFHFSFGLAVIALAWIGKHMGWPRKTARRLVHPPCRSATMDHRSSVLSLPHTVSRTSLSGAITNKRLALYLSHPCMIQLNTQNTHSNGVGRHGGQGDGEAHLTFLFASLQITLLLFVCLSVCLLVIFCFCAHFPAVSALMHIDGLAQLPPLASITVTYEASSVTH